MARRYAQLRTGFTPAETPRRRTRNKRKRPSRQYPGSPGDIEPLEPRILLSTTYTVTSLADVVETDGTVTLREAIQAANTDTAVHDAPAGSGADTIEFDAALFTSGPATITLGGSQLGISDDLTITGPGADQLTIDADSGSRVLDVRPGVAAALSGLTITGGDSGSSQGGGIQSFGAHLSLVNVTISGNSTLGHGAGMYIDRGTVDITGCTISGNAAGWSGGGIYNRGSLTVTDTTISGGHAHLDGGGIYNSFFGGGLTIANATISGNWADGYGGGIDSGGDLTSVNVTVTANRADRDDDDAGYGGGIRRHSSIPLLYNTIVAGNFRGSGTTPDDVSSYFGAGTNNLIGTGDGATGPGMIDGVDGNQVGTDGSPIDPALAPLWDNGGPTLTHALEPGSPAFEAGSNAQAAGAGLTWDQRGPGFDRFRYLVVDIGAFEGVMPGGAIGDTVWNDRNTNGQRDNGEYDFEGVAVTLWGDDGDGSFDSQSDTQRATQVTTEWGRYSFRGLAAGDYWIEVDEASPLLSGLTPTAGTSPMWVALATEQQYQVADFGYYSPLIVSTLVDEDDGDHGAGDLSLREAIGLADAASGYDVVEFDPALVGGTITLASGLGQLAINSDMEIRGLGTGLLTVNASSNSRVFYVASQTVAGFADMTVTGGQANQGAGIYVATEATVSLDGIAVTGNSATQRGGGIYAAFQSDVTISGGTISDNDAGYEGGGIYNEGTLTMSATTVSGNSASGTTASKGGGIYAWGALDAANVTITHNAASYRGGGIYAEAGAVTLTNVTVTENFADSDDDDAGDGGGIYNDFAAVMLRNTIVAGNLLGAPVDHPELELPERVDDDVSGTFDSGGTNNLIGTIDGGTGLSNGVGGNQVGTDAAVLDAGLRPQGNYGGATETHALRLDSPAIDAGDNTAAAGLSTDQRGLDRVVDHDRDGQAIVDIGAFEASVPIVVDATNDEAVDTDGRLSLREVLARADSLPMFDVIVFQDGLTGTITLDPALGEMAIRTSVDVQGPGADQLTIDADGNSRVFHIIGARDSFVTASLSGLAITGGSDGHNGGGIYVDCLSKLTLTDVGVWGNAAEENGGGVYNDQGAVLTMRNAGVFDNSAGLDGGGICNLGGNVSLTNVTISGNEAGDSGGAIMNAIDMKSLALTNATITDNVAGTGGGVCVVGDLGTTLIYNSILAGNRLGDGTPADALGPFDEDSSYNLIGAIEGSTGLATGAGTQYGTVASPLDPVLDPLTDNGGTTPTHAVGATSPAIDAGSNARAEEAGLTTDQRGEDRFKDARDDGLATVDIGAFEQQYRLNIAPTMTTVDVLGGAVENQTDEAPRPFVISFEKLLAATDAADADGNPIAFLVSPATVGMLTFGGSEVTSEVTLSAGGSLVWTPPLDTHGVVPAVFAIRAWDGWAPSSPPLDVDIKVTALAEPVNYAVLFSGGYSADKNFPRYYDNLVDMYQTLVDVYELEEHNIHVIYADGRDPTADRADGENSDMSFATNVSEATADNLQATLAVLADSVDPNDHFLFWTFDHGVGSSDPSAEGEEVLNGWEEAISDDDLAAWLGDVDAGYCSYVFTQCFSGGMVDNLLDAQGDLPANRFAAVSTTHYEASYGDSFASAFTSALRAGYRDTHDAYQYAFDRDAHARDGEGPGGERIYGVEHPWSVGGNFPLFARSDESNANPYMAETIYPLECPVGASELVITYDMLLAATRASDPDGDAIVFRLESVDVGTMDDSEGEPVVPTVTELHYGQWLTWHRSGLTEGVPRNVFSIVLMDNHAPYGDSGTVQICLGPINGGPVAVDDPDVGQTLLLQENTQDIFIDVLANDTVQGASAIESVGIGLHGTVRLTNGQVRYTPGPDYNGDDTFTYFISDASGKTDMATVTVTVVDYDPEATGSLSYSLTVLPPPPSWAGLPESWDWPDRYDLPDWETTSGVDISDDGYVMVYTERGDDDGLWYTGGTKAGYYWLGNADDPPYWNFAETQDGGGGTIHVTSTNAYMLYNETQWGNPDDPSRNIMNGVEVVSFQDLSRVVAIEYLDPFNAGEDVPTYPPEGAVGDNVGQPANETWQRISENLMPHDINSGGMALVDDTGEWGSDPTKGVVWNSDHAYERGSTDHRTVLVGWAGNRRSSAQAITDASCVVGWAEYDTNQYHAFFYDPQSRNTDPELIEIGVGYAAGWAFAVNEHNQVVGFVGASMATDSGEAFLWTDDTLTPLGTLAGGWSVAYDINDSSVIVGSSDGHAFVYVDETMYDLNALVPLSPAVVLTEAVAIHDNGQIVATGTAGGETRAFYLDILSHPLPQPGHDAYETVFDAELTVDAPGVLGNDTDALTVTDVDTTDTLGKVTWHADGSFTYDPDGQFDDLPVGQTATDSFVYSADNGHAATETATVTITVVPLGTFHVVELAPTADGFDARLSGELDPAELNLYDGLDAAVEAADVTLVGATGGQVRGSLLWDAAERTLSFTAADGPLAADTYTVTLASRADGLAALPSGDLLDGDADNAPGADYTAQFTVEDLPPRIVRVPDFARGPGQHVDVPATAAGLPITISDAEGVTSMDVHVEYDPVLLTVNDVTLAGGLPGDWSISKNLAQSGLVVLGVYGITPLTGGDVDLVILDADVPADAPYGRSHAIRLTALKVNGLADEAVADAGIHMAAYLGDADGNAIYTGFDAALIARTVVGLDSGFDSGDWTDPVIVGCSTGYGYLSSEDASLVARKAVGQTVAEIPDLPGTAAVTDSGGLEPQSSIPADIPAAADQGVTAADRTASALEGHATFNSNAGYTGTVNLVPLNANFGEVHTTAAAPLLAAVGPDADEAAYYQYLAATSELSAGQDGEPLGRPGVAESAPADKPQDPIVLPPPTVEAGEVAVTPEAGYRAALAEDAVDTAAAVDSIAVMVDSLSYQSDLGGLVLTPPDPVAEP